MLYFAFKLFPQTALEFLNMLGWTNKFPQIDKLTNQRKPDSRIEKKKPEEILLSNSKETD